MKNRKITCAEDGKKYWITERFVGCSLFVYRQVSDGIEILIVKRSEKCESFPGRWCCPCGFLDGDETGEECASRELLEETGYAISPDTVSLVGVSTSIEEYGQHVCLRYAHLMGIEEVVSLRQSSPIDTDEIEQVSWVNLRDLKKCNLCFGHFSVAMNIILKLLYDGVSSNFIENKNLMDLNKFGKRAFNNALKRKKISDIELTDKELHDETTSTMYSEFSELAMSSEKERSEHIGKYSQTVEELADIAIAVFTELYRRSVDIEQVLHEKMKFNELRRD